MPYMAHQEFRLVGLLMVAPEAPVVVVEWLGFLLLLWGVVIVVL